MGTYETPTTNTISLYLARQSTLRVVNAGSSTGKVQNEFNVRSVGIFQVRQNDYALDLFAEINAFQGHGHSGSSALGWGSFGGCLSVSSLIRKKTL